MTDRELLEAAAKAAGKLIRWDGDVCVLTEPDWSSDACSAWNPLTDDGDALRLAVKLGITDLAIAVGQLVVMEGEQANIYATVRRAIVRAAARL